MNGTEVSHVKNSAFKKLLKPQKGVMKLHIVRTVKEDKGENLSPRSISKSDFIPRCHSNSTTKSYSRSSSEISNDIGPEAVVVDRDRDCRPASRGSYSSTSNYFTKSRRGPTRENGANADRDSPTRLKGSLYSPTIHAERPSRDDQCLMKGYDQRSSQDSSETGSSNMPTKLVVSSNSLCTDSSCSSQSSGARVTFADMQPLKRGTAREYASIDYDTNNNSNKMFCGFSNSQAESVNLSFHSQSFISHNQLTVETTQTLTGSDDDEPYNLAPFARDDIHRTTVRTRSMSSLTDNRNSLLLSNGYQAESEYSQCSQASQPTFEGLMMKPRPLGHNKCEQ